MSTAAEDAQQKVEQERHAGESLAAIAILLKTDAYTGYFQRRIQLKIDEVQNRFNDNKLNENYTPYDREADRQTLVALKEIKNLLITDRAMFGKRLKSTQTAVEGQSLPVLDRRTGS